MARPSNRLSAHQLKLIVLAAVSFALIAAISALWSTLFPVPTEDLVEVAWTHECRCVDGWMDSLRANGFVVRDYELESLKARRQIWNVPDTARGCHPAVYMGYVVDGHVPPALLRRLGREHPPAIALIQSKAQDVGVSMAPSDEQFELLYRDGRHVAWPEASPSKLAPSRHS